MLFLMTLLTYHLFNFLTFMMILELGEIVIILTLISGCSKFGISPLFLFIGILVVISFAICALTVLVSCFSSQGYTNFSSN